MKTQQGDTTYFEIMQNYGVPCFEIQIQSYCKFVRASNHNNICSFLNFSRKECFQPKSNKKTRHGDTVYVVIMQNYGVSAL